MHFLHGKVGKQLWVRHWFNKQIFFKLKMRLNQLFFHLHRKASSKNNSARWISIGRRIKLKWFQKIFQRMELKSFILTMLVMKIFSKKLVPLLSTWRIFKAQSILLDKSKQELKLKFLSPLISKSSYKNGLKLKSNG